MSLLVFNIVGFGFFSVAWMAQLVLSYPVRMEGTGAGQRIVADQR